MKTDLLRRRLEKLEIKRRPAPKLIITWMARPSPDDPRAAGEKLSSLPVNPNPYLNSM